MTRARNISKCTVHSPQARVWTRLLSSFICSISRCLSSSRISLHTKQTIYKYMYLQLYHFISLPGITVYISQVIIKSTKRQKTPAQLYTQSIQNCLLNSRLLYISLTVYRSYFYVQPTSENWLYRSSIPVLLPSCERSFYPRIMKMFYEGS